MKKYASSISKVFLSLTCLLVLFACGSGEKYEEAASPAASSFQCTKCHGNATPADSLAKITDDIVDTHYDDWNIGRCSVTTTTKCAEDADCETGETCILDRLSTDPTRPNDGYILDNCARRCNQTTTQSCTADADCPAGETCVIPQRCSVTTTQACTEDADCPSGETCTLAAQIPGWAGPSSLVYKYDTCDFSPALNHTRNRSACSASCHQYHNEDTAINRQLKSSGHSNLLAEAFNYGFTNAGWSPQGVCMKCHSGSGFAAYVDASNAIYPAWASPNTTEDLYPQPFTCNSCHDGQGYPTDEDLRLRKTGTVTLTSGTAGAWNSTVVNDATINAGNSATCITCHQGRESGSSVAKALLNGNKITSADLSACLSTGCSAAVTGQSFINPHYLAAGAILYGYKGFEFQDKTYSQGITFHQSQGCVGCHMAESENPDLGGHTVAMEAENELTGERERHLEVCIPCHGPEISRFSQIGVLRDMDGDGTPDYPSREIRNLRDKLEAKLAEQGIYYSDDYPYFYSSADLSTANTNWTLGQLGAAFNLNLIKKEPGSFVHNFRYAVQLLRDSYQAIQGWSCSTTTTTSCSVDADCPAGETCKILGIRPSTGDDRPATDYTQLP